MTELKTLVILVADGYRDGADTLATLLRHHAHSAYAVYDGPAASEAAALARPDVLFVDVECAWGLELARRLGAGPARPLLVGVTTWMTSAPFEAVDITLQKPFDVATVLELIDAASRRDW